MIETLYVHRPLLNGDDLVHWAKCQGFTKVMRPETMHVTIAFSRKAIPWQHLSPLNNKVHVKAGPRDVIPLGEKAIVLRFADPQLHHRWQHILDQGASWDHEGYHPHITLTYEGDDLDLDTIEPFTGPLILGPEHFAPLEEDWEQNIDEISLADQKDGVLEAKSTRPIKYSESITGEHKMNDSLASLLMKNIDLILEAFNVDEKGNLIEVNKRKVAESDNLFHEYFVKRMNHTFRTINEADPLLDPGMNMHPGGSMNGMHPMHGMGDGIDDTGEQFGNPIDPQDPGLGGDDAQMGDMAMNDMRGSQMHHPGMGGQMGGGQMGGGQMAGGQMGPAMESEEPGEFDWVFGENTDLDVDSLFNLNEDDDDDQADDGDEGDADCDGDMDESLNEFDQGHSDFLPDGGMDHDAGANDFGGDMAGAMDGGDDMGMGGEDSDMVTVHGHTDNGGEFEFSFDPDTLGFGDEDEGGMGGDMGGGNDFLPGGGGHHEEHEPHHAGGMGDEDEMQEAAGGFHNGTPGKGNRRSKSSPMAVVPKNPATKGTAPFPSPMGNKRKKK